MKYSARVRKLMAELDELIADETDDGPCAVDQLKSARVSLLGAFEANLDSEQQAARDAADERRTIRAENGYRE
jgi:hypothetical protein